MSDSYFNTTNETGETLKEYEEKCRGQEAIVLEFFKSRTGFRYTPFDVLNLRFDSNTPITSVRRAITNLTKRGLLVKTEKKVKAQYGKENYLWQYNNKREQIKLF